MYVVELCGLRNSDWRQAGIMQKGRPVSRRPELPVGDSALGRPQRFSASSLNMRDQSPHSSEDATISVRAAQKPFSSSGSPRISTSPRTRRTALS